jgi:hypothetical protein
VGGTLPPEDSFERFLIDLQADLRVALSQPAGGGEQDGSANGRAPAAETSDVGISPSTGDQPDSVLADGASVHVQVTPPDNGGIPPLENLASSDPDFDIDNEDETETATDNAAPPQIPASPPEEHAAPLIGPASTPSSSSRTERRPGGGINWWRLYRFPAITAPPPSQGSSTPANNLRPASFPLASTTPAAGVPPSDLDSTSETTPPIAPPATDTVIPVIVVGLQSVNVNRGQPRTGDHDDLFGDEADTNGGGVEDDAEHNPFPHPFDNEATQRAQRERRWHSRAADAIRNLRPGRRGASRETQPGDAAGSRTFLIYVIGGRF